MGFLSNSSTFLFDSLPIFQHQAHSFRDYIHKYTQINVKIKKKKSIVPDDAHEAWLNRDKINSLYAVRNKQYKCIGPLSNSSTFLFHSFRG